jgi:hypothetical protein
MADKSPRQSMQKKSGASLKEKRAAKKSKAEGSTAITVVPGKKA